MTDLTAPHADQPPPPQVQMPKDRTRSLLLMAVGLGVVLLFMVVGVLRNQSDDPSVDDTEALAELIDQLTENQTLAGCRSQFAAQLVSGPQAVALKALADYGVDSGEFQAATEQLRPEQNARMVALSVDDPDEFVKVCSATDFTSAAAPLDPGPDDEPATYETCGAAILAGAAPMREGDPGYDPSLDRDGDGIACEQGG